MYPPDWQAGQSLGARFGSITYEFMSPATQVHSVLNTQVNYRETLIVVSVPMLPSAVSDGGWKGDEERKPLDSIEVRP